MTTSASNPISFSKTFDLRFADTLESSNRLRMAMSTGRANDLQCVVVVALSEEVWLDHGESVIRMSLNMLVQNVCGEHANRPTRVHCSRPPMNAWAETRDIWVLIGHDGIFHLITVRDEGSVLDWQPFPSFFPGVGAGTHESFRQTIGTALADQLILDVNRVLRYVRPS